MFKGRVAWRVATYTLCFGALGPPIGVVWLLVPTVLYPPLFVIILGVAFWLTFPWPFIVGAIIALLPFRLRRSGYIAPLIGALGGIGIVETWAHLDAAPAPEGLSGLFVLISAISAGAALVCSRIARGIEDVYDLD